MRSRGRRVEAEEPKAMAEGMRRLAELMHGEELLRSAGHCTLYASGNELLKWE